MGSRNFMMDSILKVASMTYPLNNMGQLDKFLKKASKRDNFAYKLPNGMRLNGTINKVTNEDMLVYMLTPKHFRSKKKVIYLHGGAYVVDMTRQHWQMLDKIAKLSGAAIIVPIYPLAPVNNFNDCFDKLLHFYDELIKYMDAKDLIFMGDSAGAGLALALAQNLKEIGKAVPSQTILISPWLDVSMENEEISLVQRKDIILGADELKKCGTLWSRGADLKDYRVSPIYGSLEGLGTISVFTGTDDILHPDAKKLKKIADEKNIAINYFEYENMPHVYPLFPCGDGKITINKIATELIQEN